MMLYAAALAALASFDSYSLAPQAFDHLDQSTGVPLSRGFWASPLAEHAAALLAMRDPALNSAPAAGQGSLWSRSYLGAPFGLEWNRPQGLDAWNNSLGARHHFTPQLEGILEAGLSAGRVEGGDADFHLRQEELPDYLAASLLLGNPDGNHVQLEDRHRSATGSTPEHLGLHVGLSPAAGWQVLASWERLQGEWPLYLEIEDFRPLEARHRVDREATSLGLRRVSQNFPVRSRFSWARSRPPGALEAATTSADSGSNWALELDASARLSSKLWSLRLYQKEARLTGFAYSAERGRHRPLTRLQSRHRFWQLQARVSLPSKEQGNATQAQRRGKSLGIHIARLSLENSRFHSDQRHYLLIPNLLAESYLGPVSGLFQQETWYLEGGLEAGRYAMDFAWSGHSGWTLGWEQGLLSISADYRLEKVRRTLSFFPETETIPLERPWIGLLYGRPFLGWRLQRGSAFISVAASQMIPITVFRQQAAESKSDKQPIEPAEPATVFGGGTELRVAWGLYW